MTAGSFKIFGQNAFALRLPCALGAGLAAFLIFFLVNQTLRDDKLAALASMLFLTSGLVYGVSTFAVLDSQTTEVLREAMIRLNLSARAYSRILKVARTIADLEGKENIEFAHVAEAVGYRTLDRSSWGE